MQELVFLAHRIPYPPDKGDKIRSWNFLTHLAARYRVHLGCFVDDPRDWQFTDTLRKICGECCFVALRPRLARLASLRGLLDGRALTLPYYANTKLARWTQEITTRPQVTRAFVYCSAMAQYLDPAGATRLHRIADIVDIDSEKWADYAQRVSPPWRRWLYAREARTLRKVEKQIAARFDKTIVATGAELALLRELAPEASDRLVCVSNGVDSDYFSPDRAYESPYNPGILALAFVGAMDYWPNVDAVSYFARDVLPAVRRRLPQGRFYIVGSNPTAEVMALASESVIVTGRVPDVRPYVAHASAIVAPLRIARGVQNKVLEGMAMAKAVIGSPEALNGISAEIDKDVLRARTPGEFADAIVHAVTTEAGPCIGRRARSRVTSDYAWSTSLRHLDAALDT